MSNQAVGEIIGAQELVLADVGASYFLPDTWDGLVQAEQSRFVLFDPVGSNMTYARAFPEGKCVIIPRALAGRHEAREFFLAHVDSGSSLYPPELGAAASPAQVDYFFPMQVLDIETFTLGESLDEFQVPRIDAIKLDTQGSELEILRGLDDPRMESLLLIEMEVGLLAQPTYHDAARLPDVMAYLEARHFRMINLRSSRRTLADQGCAGPEFAGSLPAVYECDVLFFKDLAFIDFPDLDSFIATLRRALALLTSYYLHGEAYDLLAQVQSLLPGEASLCEALRESIRLAASGQSRSLAAGALSLWHRDG